MNEMEVYFSSKTIDCQIPENILTEVRNTFTKSEIDTFIDGTITVKVPGREKEIAKILNKDIYNFLQEIKKIAF